MSILNLVKIGNTYNCFESGKLKISHLHKVIINNVIPFDKIDFFTYDTWRSAQELKDCVYSPRCEHVINGTVYKHNFKIDNVMFVKDVNNFWTSIGKHNYLLDIDNSFSNLLNVSLNDIYSEFAY
jgi:hypothetical protein